MSTISGLMLGRVKSLGNSHRGQVEVEFENETEDGQGQPTWARIATPMAGNDRGHWFMPEQGDEVVVGFVNDESEDPYVLGYVWSEPPDTDASPPANTEVSQRRLKSKNGHMLTFDDGDANLIEIKTAGNHAITLDDKNSKLVVKASSNYTITIDGSQLEIKVDDKTAKFDSNGIELKVGGRKMAITSSTIEFT